MGEVTAFAAISATVAALFVLALQPEPQQPVLVWGNASYTTKEQFEGYLKANGLNYNTWLARHPGAAPWEPTVAPRGASAEQRTALERVEAWARDLPPAAVAFASTFACAFVLLLPATRRRPWHPFRSRPTRQRRERPGGSAPVLRRLDGWAGLSARRLVRPARLFARSSQNSADAFAHRLRASADLSALRLQGSAALFARRVQESAGPSARNLQNEVALYGRQLDAAGLALLARWYGAVSSVARASAVAAASGAARGGGAPARAPRRRSAAGRGERPERTQRVRIGVTRWLGRVEQTVVASGARPLAADAVAVEPSAPPPESDSTPAGTGDGAEEPTTTTTTRRRRFTRGDVAFGILSVMALASFVLFVVVLVSA